MKRGKKVWVCNDGKWSRRRPGLIIATKGGSRIRVRFIPQFSENNQEIEHWFRVYKRSRGIKHYGGSYSGHFLDWCHIYKYSEFVKDLNLGEEYTEEVKS